MTIHGLLLAAGAGTRMGQPKALVRDDHGSWLVRGVRALREGGCDEVTVVLGAAADEAAPLLDGQDVSVVVAADWADGMSASLRAGLAGLECSSAAAAVVTLVDLPDVTGAVVARIVAGGVESAALRRASYDGRPGHPVLLGRDHWAGIVAEASGDRGARDYLAARDVDLVECGDLATGRDVDTRPGSR
ncbi:MAG: hypothetical protein JWO11_2515 [Nocardioides sp.]|nr:hypothetical protein [Nocardioides sp.]